MNITTTPLLEISSIEDYRQERNGYQDRAAGHPPENTTSQAYCRGYCDRLIFEFDRERAIDTHFAA